MTGALVLRAFVIVVAGLALWRAWRLATRGADPAAARLVTWGLLLRALLGCALFWVSYLELPLAPTLNRGAGHWGYALDGELYAELARDAASQGLAGIATYDRRAASVSFVQVLALAQLLLGDVAATGLLINCASFLAGALLLCRWMAEAGPPGRGPGLLALAVYSLQPSWILWATQPLKDAFFAFLVIAWFHASRRFVARLEGRRVGAALAWAAALAALAFLLAGLRAYFALIVWGALGVTLAIGLLASAAAPARRLSAAGLAVLVWLALSQVIVWSGGPLLPSFVLSVLRPWGGEVEGTHTGPTPAQSVVSMRVGFLDSGGNTQIRRPRGERESSAAPPVAPAASRAPGRAAPPASARPVGLEPAHPAAPAATPTASAPPVEPQPGRVPEGPAAASAAVPAHDGQPRIAFSRAFLSSGLAAIFLPRAVGRALGIYDAGGSAASWVFAELDTVCFAAAVACSAWLTLVAVRRQRRLSPLAAGTLLVGVTLAVLLALVVTNYGTLFRLREMVLIPLVLTPLAASAGSDGGRPRASVATAPA